MNQFLSFVHKEFLHILRDKVTIMILIILPLILIVLFGFAINTEMKNSNVVVADRMKDDVSQRLINEIDANAYFNVVDVTDHYQHIEDRLKSGEADVALILDKDLGMQILADGSEPNQAQMRVNYLQQVAVQSLQMAHGSSGDAMAQGPSGSAVSSPILSVTSRMLFNPQLKSEYNFVPGVIGLIIMLICALMTSIAIVREKEMGTMEILLASPLPPLTIIIAKLIPYFVISSFNVINILLMSKFVLGVPIAGSVGAFLLVSVVYIFVALALGLLISTVVNSQLAAMLLSVLLIVPGIYLSGMVFNIESMPVAFQRVSNIIPMRWYVSAAKRLLIQGVEFRYVVKDLLILCLQAVVLIAISLKLFKTRLE